MDWKENYMIATIVILMLAVIATIWGKAAFGAFGLLIIWTFVGAIVGMFIGIFTGRKAELAGLVHVIIGMVLGGIIAFSIAFTQLFSLTMK